MDLKVYDLFFMTFFFKKVSLNTESVRLTLLNMACVLLVISIKHKNNNNSNAEHCVSKTA